MEQDLTNQQPAATEQQPVQNPAKTGTSQTAKLDPVKQQQLKNFWNSYNDVTSSAVRDAGAITSQESKDKFFYTRPNPYNPESLKNINQNFERYYLHGSYSKLGFNPWRDNETLYNTMGSAWGDLGRAMTTGARLIPTGFMSNVRSWGDILKGDPFAHDEESAAEMEKWSAIGMSSRGGVTGFASNLLNSAGYTVGVALEMAAETLIAGALLPETGGASGAMWAERMAMTGKNIGKAFNMVEGFQKAVGTLKNFEASKSAWNYLKGGAKFLNPLENTVEAFNVLRTSQNMTTLAKLSKTAGAFHRDAMMLNATLGEAKLEGGMIANEMREKLTNEFYKENGRLPQTNEELDQIERSAKDAGDATLLWNIPGILLTNKITFDPLLKRYGKLGDQAITKAGSKLVDTGKGIAKENFGMAVKGLLKPKVYGKTAMKYFAGNFSEGVQESLQEVVAGSAKDYYTGLYKNAIKQDQDQILGENYNVPTLGDIVGKNVVDQFGGQGFETFASGFFMGGLLSIAGPVKGFVQETGSRLFNKQEYLDYKNRKKEYEEKTLSTLNEIYNDPLKYFGSGYGLGAAGETVENQNKSQIKNSPREFYDVSDQGVWSHLKHVFQTKTEGIFIDKLKSIKTMTDEAIEEAFPGTKGSEVKQKIDDIISRADFLKESYDAWNELVPNPFNPSALKKGTPEYEQEAIKYSAWESAKDHATFYGFSIERNLDRIAKIQKDILDKKSFANISSTDISVLTDIPTLNKELGFLSQEIKSLKGLDTPDARKDLSTKQRRFEMLTDFRQKLQNYFATQEFENLPKEAAKLFKEKLKDFTETTDKDLYKAYQGYMKHLAAQSNTLYFSDIELRESFNALKDIHTLKPEVKNMSSIVNMLSDSAGFEKHFKQMETVFSDLWKNKETNLKDGLNATYDRIEGNQLLNNLYRMGFVVDADEAADIIKEGKVPESFYNVVAKERVTNKESQDYKTFQAIIDDFLSARKGEPVTEQKEETPAQASSEEISETEYTEFVDNGIVSDKRLRSIAMKVMNNQNLSEKETAMFTAKTAEVNDLISKIAEEKLSKTGSKESEPVKKFKSEIEQTGPPKERSDKEFNVQGRISKINTPLEFAKFESEMLAILADYDRMVEEGITPEVEQQLFEAIKIKEKALVNAFDPKTLKAGNIVQMINKEFDKAIVLPFKPSDKEIKFKKLADGRDVIYVPKDKLKNFVKYKYSDTMNQFEKVDLTVAEKKIVSENHKAAEDFTKDVAAVTELQEQSVKEGFDKVTNDFFENLGCK